MPQATGPKPPFTALLNGYVHKASIASQRDLAVATTLWNVGNLAPPAALLTPAMIARVLLAARRGPVGPVLRASPLQASDTYGTTEAETSSHL